MHVYVVSDNWKTIEIAKAGETENLAQTIISPDIHLGYIITHIITLLIFSSHKMIYTQINVHTCHGRMIFKLFLRVYLAWIKGDQNNW